MKHLFWLILLIAASSLPAQTSDIEDAGAKFTVHLSVAIATESSQAKLTQYRALTDEDDATTDIIYEDERFLVDSNELNDIILRTQNMMTTLEQKINALKWELEVQTVLDSLLRERRWTYYRGSTGPKGLRPMGAAATDAGNTVAPSTTPVKNAPTKPEKPAKTPAKPSKGKVDTPAKPNNGKKKKN